MTDQLDRAQALEEAERAAAIARFGRGQARAGTALCLSCGEAIASARRRALPHACLCIGCQTEFERAVRRVAR